MDMLLELTPLGNTSDARKLQGTYDKIEAHVSGLQALDYLPSETYGSLSVPVRMTKIPEDIRLLVGREIKDGEWNLAEILRLLRNDVENREICEGDIILVRKRNHTVLKMAGIIGNKNHLAHRRYFGKSVFKLYNTLYVL